MSNLYSSYERLARVYAKKAGINLIIRGGGFSTDGKKIVIAEVPNELTKTLKDPALAGLVHECLHVEHSWFPRNEKEVKEKMLDQFQLRYRGLINNIEDIRMLNLGRKEYPGMDSLQKNGLKFIEDSFLDQKIKEKKIPLSSLLGMCIHWKESNENTNFFPPTVNQMAELTKDIWHGVNWNPCEKGYDEAENIAKRIMKRLKQQQQTNSKEKEEGKEEKQNKEKNGKEKGKKNNKSKQSKEKNKEKSEEEKGNKENKGKQSKKEREEENEEEKGNKDNKDEGDISNENEKEEEKTKESNKKEMGKEMDGNEENINQDEINPAPSSTKETGNTDYDGKDLKEDLEKLFDEDVEGTSSENNSGLMEIMTKIIETTIQKHNSNLQKHIPHPGIIIHDIEEHIKNPFKNKQIDPYDIFRYKEKLRASLKKIDKEAKKLKAKALPLLMAEKRDSFIFEQKEGIIDGAQLYKIQKGNGNIYKQKVLGRRVNTAVTILCDVSGSMTGSKIKMLQSTLLVIGDTMLALKIPFEILSYTTSHSRHPEVQKIKEEYYENRRKSPYNRIEPLLLTIIKDFNENYSNIRNLIPMMTADRNTPTNEAFKWGCKRLIQRNENRKLLFILEDGHPGLDNSSRFLLEKDLIENVADAEKNNLEIIGIGLLSDEVKKFYNNSIIINDVAQISLKVYQALLKALNTHHQNRR